MKKVGIITIVNYDNYGNKLQNYATQELLKDLGYEAETIINDGKYKKIINLLKYHGIRFFDRYPRIIAKDIFKNKLLKNKIERFKEFSGKNINESKFKIYIDDIKKLNHKEYHKFVVGSDQIWNPNFRSGGNSNDFLCFTPKNKRIAFSPSIGVSKLSEVQEKKYSEWLNNMEFLSCREEEGAKLISELTGKKVEVLVDPTMVIDTKKWEKFSQKQNGKTNKKYLLTYFLGSVSGENNDKLKEIAEENDLEIINLRDENNPKVYIADPCEWVDYVKEADFFCTDSFHGVVFSILMKTPFAIFNRGGKIVSMNSRIDTVLKKFNFEERHWDILKEKTDYLDIKFDHCDEIISRERKKSLLYLKNALEN